jgi:hypothetical protein
MYMNIYLRVHGAKTQNDILDISYLPNFYYKQTFRILESVSVLR